MAHVIDIPFTHGSHLGGVRLVHHEQNERTSHGAPDTMTLLRGDMPVEHFSEVSRKWRQAMNQVPDHVNIRPAEVRGGGVSWDGPGPNSMRFDYPNNSQGKALSGSADESRLESIRRDDLATFAAKSLRELRAMGAISDEDHRHARTEVAMAGIGEVQPTNQVKHFKEGQELVPSHSVHGYGMRGATRDFLEKPPQPAVTAGGAAPVSDRRAAMAP